MMDSERRTCFLLAFVFGLMVLLYSFYVVKGLENDWHPASVGFCVFALACSFGAACYAMWAAGTLR